MRNSVMPNSVCDQYILDKSNQSTSLEQVVRNMYKLGLTWQEHEDNESAEIAYRLVMEVKDANPTFNSAEFVFSANNLAGILNMQRKHLEAEHLYLKATTAALDFFGMQHPAFASILRNYAYFLHRVEFPFEAENIYQQAEDDYAQGFAALAHNLLIREDQSDEADCTTNRPSINSDQKSRAVVTHSDC
jgi:tetratricopeptide (TPR) repeat protein